VHSYPPEVGIIYGANPCSRLPDRTSVTFPQRTLSVRQNAANFNDEKPRMAQSNFNDPAFANRRPTCLPLPSGEGRGEGEL
jgi:hypothetical protein